MQVSSKSGTDRFCHLSRMHRTKHFFFFLILGNKGFRKTNTQKNIQYSSNYNLNSPFVQKDATASVHASFFFFSQRSIKQFFFKRIARRLKLDDHIRTNNPNCTSAKEGKKEKEKKEKRKKKGDDVKYMTSVSTTRWSAGYNNLYPHPVGRKKRKEKRRWGTAARVAKLEQQQGGCTETRHPILDSYNSLPFFFFLWGGGGGGTRAINWLRQQLTHWQRGRLVSPRTGAWKASK